MTLIWHWPLSLTLTARSSFLMEMNTSSLTFYTTSEICTDIKKDTVTYIQAFKYLIEQIQRAICFIHQFFELSDHEHFWCTVQERPKPDGFKEFDWKLFLRGRFLIDADYKMSIKYYIRSSYTTLENFLSSATINTIWRIPYLNIPDRIVFMKTSHSSILSLSPPMLSLALFRILIPGCRHLLLANYLQGLQVQYTLLLKAGRKHPSAF